MKVSKSSGTSRTGFRIEIGAVLRNRPFRWLYLQGFQFSAGPAAEKGEARVIGLKYAAISSNHLAFSSQLLMFNQLTGDGKMPLSPGKALHLPCCLPDVFFGSHAICRWPDSMISGEVIFCSSCYVHDCCFNARSWCVALPEQHSSRLFPHPLSYLSL